ncbi:MAG: sulfate adenylyltransferase [Nitrospirae bacterium]|nr:sulfate adenylyltransferase [Nitrospirota bacterium]
MTMSKQTAENAIPHGGKLINRILDENGRKEALNKAKNLKKKELTVREVSDLEMIAIGAFSPLEGFMTGKDYDQVVRHMHLSNGLPWTIPVTLSATEEETASFKNEKEIALLNEKNEVLAILQIEDIFPQQKELEAAKVYRTDSKEHPGVNQVFQMGEMLLGGKISLVNRPQHENFQAYRMDPAETRAAFVQKGWNRVVGFQTRNPIHRAHEYIQKCALEMVDGLLVHPLVGATKGDDIPADVRMRCYEVLLSGYYPKDRSMLSVFPANMRYAGPREAIFHALVRKNYGCTHFIVGRDHAGVGNYYGTFDAHHIFSEFKPSELGITPLFFDNTFFCKKCQSMASVKTCPHDTTEQVSLSGTKVREMLKNGILPPPEFSRPEVASILIDAMKS